jgi:hypothetical protein
VPSVWRRRSRTLLTLALLAALATAARLPFLLRADRFFDSDEAVEGLMALHVLQGEFPAVLWGQGYKGVPEVYIAAAVFALVGPSVAALKAATLACFIVFLGVQFALLARLFSVWVAWAASLLLVACPPSLVAWSLSANAEIVMTMLAGTVLLLAWDRWNATRSPRALAAAAAAAGFGFWVHQYIVYYLAALALTVWWRQPRHWSETFRFLRGSDATPLLRWWLRALLTVSAFYAMLGAAAFAGAGFDFAAAGQTISVHHPQKMWRIAAALAVLGIVPRWLARSRPSWSVLAAAAAGFLAGYAPALVHQLQHGGAAPIAEMTGPRLLAALTPIGDTVIPIVAGFKAPFTGRLAVPAWTAILLVAALAIAYTRVRHRAATFFQVFVVTSIVIFLFSGSYIDAQSYRYLMPVHAALPVLYALAAERAWRSGPAGGVLLMSGLIGVFHWQQLAWYRTLEPDVAARTALRCAAEQRVTRARADYWLSYKLTFLSGEQLIVAPVTGVDRHPPYTEEVERHDPVPRFRVPPLGTPVSCDSVVE